MLSDSCGNLPICHLVNGFNSNYPPTERFTRKTFFEFDLCLAGTKCQDGLPGTQLWDQMKVEGRISLNAFPEDWKYYTLTYPVARYKHLSLDGIIQEMISCNRNFYSTPRILRRVCGNVWQRRAPLISFVGNLSCRSNIRVDCEAYANFKCQRGDRFD